MGGCIEATCSCCSQAAACQGRQGEYRERQHHGYSSRVTLLVSFVEGAKRDEPRGSQEEAKREGEPGASQGPGPDLTLADEKAEGIAGAPSVLIYL